MKKTEWFPGDVRPVHKGWYERKYGAAPDGLQDYWGGKKWHYDEKSSVCLNQRREWRGLAEQPK